MQTETELLYVRLSLGFSFFYGYYTAQVMGCCKRLMNGKILFLMMMATKDRTLLVYPLSLGHSCPYDGDMRC